MHTANKSKSYFLVASEETFEEFYRTIYIYGFIQKWFWKGKTKGTITKEKKLIHQTSYRLHCQTHEKM